MLTSSYNYNEKNKQKSSLDLELEAQIQKARESYERAQADYERTKRASEMYAMGSSKNLNKEDSSLRSASAGVPLQLDKFRLDNSKKDLSVEQKMSAEASAMSAEVMDASYRSDKPLMSFPTPRLSMPNMGPRRRYQVNQVLFVNSSLLCFQQDHLLSSI